MYQICNEFAKEIIFLDRFLTIFFLRLKILQCLIKSKFNIIQFWNLLSFINSKQTIQNNEQHYLHFLLSIIQYYTDEMMNEWMNSKKNTVILSYFSLKKIKFVLLWWMKIAWKCKRKTNLELKTTNGFFSVNIWISTMCHVTPLYYTQLALN